MADIELMIKIPDHLYKLLKDFPSDSNEGTIENVLMKAIDNGTPIPDNATNGDMIKALFSNTVIEQCGKDCIGIVYEKNIYDVTFSREWWNNPYQKGGK